MTTETNECETVTVRQAYDLDDVRDLVASGRFHHATVRTIGMPRIWVYAKNPDGFRGYTLVGSIADTVGNHNYFISIGHGVSVGSYGVG